MSPVVHYVCDACGASVEKYIVPSRQAKAPARFCDRTCAGKWRQGANHPRWKGRRTERDGYVYVHAPDHPHATAHAEVLEHRLVMEARLGRYLLLGEVVHHENDDPSDNRIENLRLFASQAEHKRHHDRDRRRDGNGRYLPV